MRLFHYALLIAVIVLFGTKARAHDNGQYGSVPDDVKYWFNHQHDKDGNWCCDESDGQEYFGDYQINADGSVEFDVGGVHHKIPDQMVLTDSNPTGHAVWWHTGAKDYCFAVGPGG